VLQVLLDVVERALRALDLDMRVWLASFGTRAIET
jgi:hypothetical protein